MKTTSIIFLFLILMMTGCKKDPVIVKGFYESMHFIREGGGQIEFTLTPTDNPDKFKAVVTRFGISDSTTQITIDINNDNRSALSLLDQAMKNQIQINGDFKQSTLFKGTWAYIYLVTDKKETEVTNTELRNSILQLEQLIRDKIQ
jgi:hypothetical protein